MTERGELQVVRESATRIADERDLSQIAGRYFTTVVDIEERVEHSLREGEEVSFKARRAVAAGTTLLVLRLRFLDEQLHSVEMMAHPTDRDRSALAFMPDEFFTWFVPADDSVREGEIAALEARIREANRRIRDTQRQLALAAPSRQAGENALVVSKSVADALAERMKALVADAQQRRTEISEFMKSQTELGELLKRYRDEYGAASIAMMDDQIEFGLSVTEKMKTVSFFTGEGVEVQTLREGAPAPSDAPLTLYQSLLYLDEELAVNLLSHGFDYRSMPDLANILDDMSLVERMIPAPRGAVLVRIRREDVQYVPVQTLADIVLNSNLNMENKTTYLLVRNGENVHLVHSEVTSGETRHLFPARKEIDDIFKRFGTEIRPEHLDYSNAKDAFEKRTVFYRRLVLMLWGLDERMSLFGDFHSQGGYDGWFDDRFHLERMVYVHDAEDVLEHKRQSFAQWAEEKNRHLQVGSRVAVSWELFFNDESAPDGFEYRKNHVEQLWYPVQRHGIHFVEKSDDALVVRTKTEFGRYGSGKTKTFKVRAAEGLSPYSGLCLDFVDREELQYFLNSRRERRNYAYFLAMYRMIDDHLKIEEEMQARTLADLCERMSHAGLDAEVAEKALRRAVSLWRAQNGGKLLGGAGWKPKTTNLVLDMAFALAGERNDLLSRARKDIAGCVPIELRIDGHGRLLLYRELKEGEGFPGIEHFDKAWVAKSVLRIARDGKVSEDGPPEVTYLHNPDFERQSYRKNSRVFRRYDREVTLVRDVERKSAWKEAQQPDWLMPEEGMAIAQAAGFDAEEALAGLDARAVRAGLWEILRYGSYKYDRYRRVDRGRVVVPLAIVRTDTRFGLVQLAGEGLEVYAAFGPAMEAEAIIAANRVETPESSVSRVRHVAQTFGPDRLPLSFEVIWHSFDRGRPGITFDSDNTPRGHRIDVSRPARWIDGASVAQPPYDSLDEAVKANVVDNTTQQGDGGFALHFMTEGSRRTAEKYFQLIRKRNADR